MAWSLTGVHASNWHPLTWISHMLDIEMYGREPAGHHLTNVALHAANACLLFVGLVWLTGATWRPALVAGLFALHPLHVESVAWLLERKDVLGTLFWLLATGAYVLHVRRPSVTRYLLVLALFAAGLMSKPMLVTLPLTLLLVDVWPLGRRPTARLLFEKVPLLAMSAVVSAITVVAQGEAVASVERFPLAARLANAAVSYVTYLAQAAWPAGLGFYYPYPPEPPLARVAAAAVLLVAITWMVLRTRSLRPYLVTGWLWYLVTLLPVIGLVQVGAQARADRYTYVPLIGIFVVVAWAAGQAARALPRLRPAIAVSAAAAVVACGVVSSRQLEHWRGPQALLTRSVQVADSYFARYNLANHLKRAGELEQAATHYRRALELQPGSADAHYNLGNTLMALGRFDDADSQFSATLAIAPAYADAYYARGNLALSRGDPGRAIADFEQALRLRPDDPEVLNNLGSALLRQGQAAAALARFERALALRQDARFHNNIGAALVTLGRTEEALASFERALALDPAHAGARRNLEAARALRE